MRTLSVLALPHKLFVSPQEMSDLLSWTALPESQFLENVYHRWSHLRDLPIGTEVRVVVDWWAK